MQIIILCGGLATRMLPITEKIPKSMIEIKDKPILWYQIMLLKKQGIKKIVLCVGHLSEYIREYFKDGKKFGIFWINSYPFQCKIVNIMLYFELNYFLGIFNFLQLISFLLFNDYKVLFSIFFFIGEQALIRNLKCTIIN